MGDHPAIGIISRPANRRRKLFVTGFRLVDLKRVFRIITDAENTHEGPACDRGKRDERLKLMTFVNGSDSAEEGKNILPSHR
ncbi:MAG: hypothetical protein H5T71_11495 [Chloroflexi bacterium]|nr:hypothetical protein [Chloroflexota bacterium]